MDYGQWLTVMERGIKNGLMPEPRTIYCESFTAATELRALASIYHQAGLPEISEN